MRFCVTFDAASYEVEASDSVEAMRLGRILHGNVDVKHQSCVEISEGSPEPDPILDRLGPNVRYLSNEEGVEVNPLEAGQQSPSADAPSEVVTPKAEPDAVPAAVVNPEAPAAPPVAPPAPAPAVVAPVVPPPSIN